MIPPIFYSVVFALIFDPILHHQDPGTIQTEHVQLLELGECGRDDRFWCVENLDHLVKSEPNAFERRQMAMIVAVLRQIEYIIPHAALFGSELAFGARRIEILL